MKTVKNRIASYDVMRIVAILLVLYNHLPGYHLFYNGEGAALVGGMAMSVLTRIGVPLFAMVSGALLLGRNETYADLWRKRIWRMLLVIVVFEALLYVEFHYTRQYPISLSDFIYGVFGGTLRDMTSYWFLYAYLGFLIMLPFLRRVAQAMTRADFLWLMGVHVLLTTGPTAAAFVSKSCGAPVLALSGSMAVSLSSVMLYFYPLIGYWIDRNIDPRRISRRQWALLWLAVLVGAALSGWMTWFDNVHSGGHSQTYLGLTVYVTAIAVFLSIKRVFTAEFALRRPRLNALLSLTGSLVFGVYLLDQGLKLLVYERMKDTLLPLLGTFGFSVFWCMVSLVVCGAVTWELKQLPLFRRIL